MPAPYFLEFNDAEGLLLAVALEQFADASRASLAPPSGAIVSDAVRAYVLQQIATVEAILMRLNKARF